MQYMKLTFGRVMACIIATLFIYFVVVHIIDKIENKRYRENCPNGIDEGAFRLTVMDSSQMVGAKVFALHKHTGKVTDSAVITHSSSGYYYLDKELNTRYNWKIKLNDGHDILISDIKTDLVEYWTSFGPTYRSK
jgi:hypothetical protein